MKLSKLAKNQIINNIHKILLNENTKIDSNLKNSIDNLSDKLLKDKKFIALTQELLSDEPSIVNKLGSKLSNVVSLNEELSSIDFNFSKIEQLASNLLKDIDIDINESELLSEGKLISKIIVKIAFLLGLRNTKLVNILKYVLTQYLEDFAADTLDNSYGGNIGQYISVCIAVLAIIYNLIMLLKTPKKGLNLGK